MRVAFSDSVSTSRGPAEVLTVDSWAATIAGRIQKRNTARQRVKSVFIFSLPNELVLTQPAPSRGSAASRRVVKGGRWDKNPVGRNHEACGATGFQSQSAAPEAFYRRASAVGSKRGSCFSGSGHPSPDSRQNPPRSASRGDDALDHRPQRPIAIGGSRGNRRRQARPPTAATRPEPARITPEITHSLKGVVV